MDRIVNINGKEYEVTYTNRSKELLETLEDKSVFDIAIDLVVSKAVTTKIRSMANLLYAGLKYGGEFKGTRDEVLDLMPVKTTELIPITAKLVDILLEDTGIKEQWENATNKNKEADNTEKK